MLFVGDDWSEKYHDVELVADDGTVLDSRKLLEGAAGLATLHAMIGACLGEGDDVADVVIGTETDRGPWVAALIASGYLVYAVNPLMVARYRERHNVSGAKSDPGDAHVLAEMVRLDRAHHRRAAADSTVAEEVKILARSHKSMIWARQRQANGLRSLLREFYPAAVALWGADFDRYAAAILIAAPTPEEGRKLTKAQIKRILVQTGRRRYVTDAVAEIYEGLHREGHLQLRPGLSAAHGVAVRAQVTVLAAQIQQIAVLEAAVTAGFGRHPDAEIYLSQPGLGPILGARVASEFGDAPDRYGDARARRNYGGSSPVTRRSGTKIVIHARYARNDRLADALFMQAERALPVSPGAKAYYDRRIARKSTHPQAIRAVSTGSLESCTDASRTTPLTTRPSPPCASGLGETPPLIPSH
jgi:Transposase/Transposase IS116/IS110/IS902 family